MSDTANAIPVTEVGTGGCACGHAEESPVPVLDARAIPHAIRHAAIFGALDSLEDGSAMVLIAPHRPVNLLKQANERYGGTLSVEILEKGQGEWHLRLERTSVSAPVE